MLVRIKGAISNCYLLRGERPVLVDTGAPGMAPILDRMRRRQVRYCWQLAAEMRGVEPVPGAIELTPEDPADLSATDLQGRPYNLLEEGRPLGALFS